MLLKARRTLARWFRKPTVRVALFGERYVGKSTLLTCFYGNQRDSQQRDQRGYALLLQDRNLHERILAAHAGLRTTSRPLEATHTWSTVYDFALRVEGDNDRNVFQMQWVDYYGGWWNNSPSNPSERARRDECLRWLLGADLGLFLIDGQRFRQLEERRHYVPNMLRQFRDELRNQRQELAKERRHLLFYPKLWIVCLTKADLYPEDYRAENFADDLRLSGVDQLIELRDEIGSLTGDKDVRFGPHFLLLSAAAMTSDGGLDLAKTLGLDLLPAVIFYAHLQRYFPRRARRSVEEGEPGWLTQMARRVLDWVFGVPGLGALMDLLSLGLEEAADRLRAWRRRVRQRRERRGQMLLAMCEQLHSPSARRLYHRDD
jgi:GTPase SAR1 family protein